MTQAAPQFPSRNVWEGMSELEQDALLDQIERVRRRKLLVALTGRVRLGSSSRVPVRIALSGYDRQLTDFASITYRAQIN
jgi:hypothetical protein